MSESNGKDISANPDIIYTISSRGQDEKGEIITLIPVDSSGKPLPNKLGKSDYYDKTGKKIEPLAQSVIELKG